MKYVLQYSVDIEIDEADISENQIISAIENYIPDAYVRGCCWQASWTVDGYDRCEQPISSN